MTYGREVIAYVLAHLGGYVVSTVLSQVVLVPMMVASGMVRSQLTMFAAFFLLYVVVQIGVFFAFIAIRGRRAAG